MQKIAVFIDRDGVINYDPGHFHKIKELQIFPNVGKAIKLLNQNNIPAIVVTNQAVVARGWITEQQVKNIHNKISKIIAKDNAIVDKFYYCPHHPEADIEKYKKVCTCRKPGPGMFLKAAKKFNLDLKNSYVIGDSFREIEAAKNLKCSSIAVECGRGEFNDSIPDYKVKDLFEAVQLIISRIT